MNSGWSGACKGGNHGRIQLCGNLEQIGQGRIVDLGIAAPEIGLFCYAWLIGTLHIDAVGIVTALAKQAFAARYGNVRNDVIAHAKPQGSRLVCVAIHQSAHKLMPDNALGGNVQRAAHKVQVGAANAAGDQRASAIACGGFGDFKFSDLKRLVRSCKYCCFYFHHSSPTQCLFQNIADICLQFG